MQFELKEGDTNEIALIAHVHALMVRLNDVSDTIHCNFVCSTQCIVQYI